MNKTVGVIHSIMDDLTFFPLTDHVSLSASLLERKW